MVATTEPPKLGVEKSVKKARKVRKKKRAAEDVTADDAMGEVAEKVSADDVAYLRELQEQLELEQEKLAAEEAGIGFDDDGDGDEAMASADDEDDDENALKKTKEVRVKVVDLAYLRDLQEKLTKRRTSLQASQDLLRVFRSGRQLAVSDELLKRNKKNARKPKKRKSKTKATEVVDDELEDESEDELEDDGSYTAGKVRFVSAKAYQKAMNMAIIGIQTTLDTLLGKVDAKGEAVSGWMPAEHKRWSNLEPMFRVFAYHLLAMTEHMKDAATLRFLLKRLELLAPYTKSNPGLTRKLGTVAVSVWTSSDRDVSRPTKLRAYYLLHALASEEGNTEIVLRKVCASFFTNLAVVCNVRTLPSILFATSCITELFGIDMGVSYSVAFTQLRQLAVTLRAVLTSKDKKKDIEKVYNWSTINSIRLWSSILSQYGGEDELESLIYPFVQVSLGILKLQQSPKSYPLRLLVCAFLIDLVKETGVFIPIAPHLLVVLRCGELKQVPKRGAIRELEWRALLRVEDQVVATQMFLGGVIRGVVLELSKYFAAISKHVAFPEIAHPVVVELTKVAKEVRVKEWKQDLVALRDHLKKTSTIIAESRSKCGVGPKEALFANGMLHKVEGMTDEAKMPILRFYELESKRRERAEQLRDDALAENSKQVEKE